MSDVIEFDAIRERLADLAEPGRPVRTLLRKAAAVAGVSERDLLSPRRDAHLCWVRFGVMFAANENFSLAAIGRVLGRDHTTIMHGVRRGRKLLAEDPAFAAYVEILMRA